MGELGEASEVPWQLKLSEENLLGPCLRSPWKRLKLPRLRPTTRMNGGDDREVTMPIALEVAEAVSIIEVELDDGTSREEDVVVLVAEEAAPLRDLSEDLRQAIEANRVDLYVQPVVTVPERQVRYFDAVPRIRTGDDT